MKDEEVAQVLSQLAREDWAAWESEPAPALVPEGCPSMPRLYTAVLREDWTTEETEAIRASRDAQRVLAKVRDNVWYPTVLQLVKYQYARDLLSEDERADIQYHLEIDRCQRSRRLLRWLSTGTTLHRTLSHIKDWTEQALDDLARWAERVLAFQGWLQPASVPAGFASPEPTLAQQITSDDGRTSATLSRDGVELWLTVECRDRPPGTLLRIALTDVEGRSVWSGFGMLPEGRDGTVCKFRLDPELPGPCAVFAEVLDSNSLAASDAEDLRKAFANAKSDEAGSIPAWRQWAQGVVVVPEIDAAVREVLTEIVAEA